MKQQRHASNELYRSVAHAFGLELLRHEQEDVTGKPVSIATVKRYYNGYGNQAIPQSGFNAALRLTNATFLVAKELSQQLSKPSRNRGTASKSKQSIK